MNNFTLSTTVEIRILKIGRNSLINFLHKDKYNKKQFFIYSLIEVTALNARKFGY